MIPQICENFNFVKELEINLNNYALNFDHLPQQKSVQRVEKLIVRKNKFLFQPLVTMVSNLTYL